MEFKKEETWFSCPFCGQPVAEGRSSCSECGSDEETGWNDEAESNPYLLGGDYDEAVENEFGEKEPNPLRLSVGVIVIVALLFGLISAGVIALLSGFTFFR